MRFENVSLYLQILAICILAVLIKGETSFDSIIGIPKCSWLSQLILVILLAITYRYARYIFKKQYQSDIRK
jgi:multisubunit Na+/H+ antiporter MnhF subunit